MTTPTTPATPDAPAAEAMTEAELDELERLEKAATPGPYESFKAQDGQRAPVGVLDGNRNIRIADVGDRRMTTSEINDTAEFLAASRNAMPRLLAEVRRLRGASRLRSAGVRGGDAGGKAKG
jgi:hypothetical protein